MKIPRDCNGAELARALRKFGYRIERQTGSHLVLTSAENGEHHVTVPNHHPIKVGTLRIYQRLLLPITESPWNN
jgi:predicted RNA binding protein YcfA (HicA-like mRNA interferase family)